MANRTDELLSKGMAKAKAVKARLSGLIGVFNKLAEQHGEVSAMLMRVKGNENKRSELWPLIRKNLLAHERAELRTVYPELAQHDMTRPMAEHHDREAGELEELIRRLDAENMKTEQWGRLFDELVQTVQHHVDEEEKSIFPKAQEVLGDARVKELEPTFVTAFEQAKQSV